MAALMGDDDWMHGAGEGDGDEIDIGELEPLPIMQRGFSDEIEAQDKAEAQAQAEEEGQAEEVTVGLRSEVPPKFSPIDSLHVQKPSLSADMQQRISHLTGLLCAAKANYIPHKDSLMRQTQDAIISSADVSAGYGVGGAKNKLQRQITKFKGEIATKTTLLADKRAEVIAQIRIFMKRCTSFKHEPFGKVICDLDFLDKESLLELKKSIEFLLAMKDVEAELVDTHVSMKSIEMAKLIIEKLEADKAQKAAAAAFLS
jgi:hypothetical protein